MLHDTDGYVPVRFGIRTCPCEALRGIKRSYTCVISPSSSLHPFIIDPN